MQRFRYVCVSCLYSVYYDYICIYVYIYTRVMVHRSIYIYRERETERQREREKERERESASFRQRCVTHRCAHVRGGLVPLVRVQARERERQTESQRESGKRGRQSKSFSGLRVLSLRLRAHGSGIWSLRVLNFGIMKLGLRVLKQLGSNRPASGV